MRVVVRVLGVLGLVRCVNGRDRHVVLLRIRAEGRGRTVADGRKLNPLSIILAVVDAYALVGGYICTCCKRVPFTCISFFGAPLRLFLLLIIHGPNELEDVDDEGDQQDKDQDGLDMVAGLAVGAVSVL